MAGAGTGLPTVGTGGVTPLVDLTGSAGIGERFAAEAIGDLSVMVREGFDTFVRPRLAQRAVEDATQDVLSGREYRERTAVTEVGEAYNRTLRAGTLSRLTQEDDAALGRITAEHPFDAAGFQQASEEYFTRALEGTPSALAIERSDAFRRRQQDLLTNLRVSQVREDAREAGRALVDRHETLIARIAQSAENGAAYDPTNPLFAGDMFELENVYAALQDHPLAGLNEEAIDALRVRDGDRFRAAAFAGHVRTIFREEGSDAALAALQSALPGTEAPEGSAAALVPASARTLAYELAAEALSQETGIARQRETIAAAERRAAADRVNSLIEAMRYGGAVDHDELRRAAESSGDPGLVARARFAIEVGVQPPEGFGRTEGGTFEGDSSAAGGFAGAMQWLWGAEGSALVADDNGAGRARFGITERSHPQAWADGDVSRAEAERIYRTYWDAVGGDRLPPALALVAFDTAVNFGADDARAWIEQSGGDVGRFLALREAEYRRLARENPRQYADDLNGWLGRNARLRQAAARIQAFQNNQDGFASDPLSFALGGPSRPALARVDALQTEAVFTPGGRAGWIELIRQRRATGAQLAEQYQVPRRILTNGEVAFYRDRIERDPGAAVELARATTEALGGQGARDFLSELGRGDTAPTLIHIADLAGPGGNPAYARLAALGLTLASQGRSLPTTDRTDIDEALSPYRAIFREAPSLLAAVSNTARAAALADQVTGTLREPDYYVQRALGRTTWGSNPYGGGAEVNGVSVVAPRWLNPAYFDDALEAMAEDWADRGIGPVYANGQPMPAREVARLRPVLMSDGRYALANRHGQVAVAPSGAEFRVNMDGGRAFLRARLGPSAVRPD